MDNKERHYREMKGNGWKEWENYVLKELNEHNNKLEDLRGDMGDIKVMLATLKERIAVRSAVFGGLGSLIAVAIYLIIALLT